MAVVYIDYRLYASSDQTISGTWIKTERRSHWKGSACIQMYMFRTSQNSSPMFDRRLARSTSVSVDRHCITHTWAENRWGHLRNMIKCRWQDKMFNILLWTRKVLCGSFLCAIYKFSFIHSSPTPTPHPRTKINSDSMLSHVVACIDLDGLLLVSSPWGHPEWWTEAVYLWICVHFVLYFCLHRVGRFDFRKSLHRREKSLEITITTVTIYFIHPNGKFKLSFDRTTKNIFQ